MNKLSTAFKWIVGTLISFSTPLLVIGTIYLYKLNKFIVDNLVPGLDRDDLGIASIISLLATLIILICLICELYPESSKDTSHLCDICKTKLKVGEGHHFPGYGKDGGCYCVCEDCYPTCHIDKLTK